MSDRLDDRIKELYSELTDAAPEVRALPPRVPAARPAPFYARPPVWAGAAAVLVAVLGVGFLIQRADFAGDDDASATTAAATTAATTTTSAAAETTTTVAAPTDAPTTAATTAAPTTTAATATTSVPETTISPEARRRFLDEVNRACQLAIGELAMIPLDPVPETYIAVADALSRIRITIDTTEGGVTDQQRGALRFWVEGAEMLITLQATAPAPDPIGEMLGLTSSLGSLLSEFGANDCIGLEGPWELDDL